MLKERIRSKLLWKYIRINFLVIFLPIVIGSVIYCIAIQHNYEEKYLATVEYAANEKLWHLEARVQAFVSTAQQISMEEDFTPYHLTSSSYETVEAIKKLKTLTLDSGYFEDLMICLNDSEKLYTSNGVVDIRTLMSKTYLPGGTLSAEAYRELFDSKRYFNGTKDGEYVFSGPARYRILTYPLGRTAGSAYGVLLGFYRDDWKEKIGAEREEEGKRLMLVCSSGLEILYAQMPAKAGAVDRVQEPLAEFLRDWDGMSEYYDLELNGTDYVGKVLHSALTGWYLIDMVDDSVISWELFMLQLPMLIIIFLSLLLLTVFLSIMLSMYNYMPIRRLYGLFDKKQTEGDNELLSLDQYIRDMIEDQSNIEKRLLENVKVGRMELMEKLLRGSIDTSLPAVRNRLEEMGIRLDAEVLAVLAVVVQPEKRKEFETAARAVRTGKTYKVCYYTDRVYKDYGVFLVGLKRPEELTEFCEYLRKKMGSMIVKMGVGTPCVAVKDLKYSLMEAVTAVEKKEGDLVFYSELALRRKEEFYGQPLKNELRLSLLLIRGGESGLEEVLSDLYEEMMEIGKTSSDATMSYLMGRIFGTLFAHSLCIRQEGGDRYLHYADINSFFANLREFCRAELACQAENRAAQGDERMKKILRFVDENFMRQEMSLALAAEQFGMTGPHMSKLFKAAAGKNFIDYVTEKRLALAARLLVETDDTIAEIVEKVGYSDAASFTRRFTREYLVPPGTWRKEQREKRQG